MVIKRSALTWLVQVSRTKPICFGKVHPFTSRGQWGRDLHCGRLIGGHSISLQQGNER